MSQISQHCGILAFLFFCCCFFIFSSCKLLNRILPLYPHTTHLGCFLCLLYQFLLLYATTSSRLLFFARNQERRFWLCPLCRSLAVCQTEPMPIKPMSNGLKLLHLLCFPLFPMACKFEAGLN